MSRYMKRSLSITKDVKGISVASNGAQLNMNSPYVRKIKVDKVLCAKMPEINIQHIEVDSENF